MLKRRLDEDDIAVLKKKWAAIQEARRILEKLPLNERVRNALFTAGLSRLLADSAPDRKIGKELLEDHWHTVREILKNHFYQRQVDQVFDFIEKGSEAPEDPEEN